MLTIPVQDSRKVFEAQPLAQLRRPGEQEKKEEKKEDGRNGR